MPKRLKRPFMLHDHLPILAFQDPSVLRAGLTCALHESTGSHDRWIHARCILVIHMVHSILQ